LRLPSRQLTAVNADDLQCRRFAKLLSIPPIPPIPLSWTLPSGDDAQAASWFLAVANVLQSREDCWLAAAIPGLFMIATACLKSPRRLFGSA
jgi:hypothetical protein